MVRVGEYELLETIGRGTYSKVKRVKHLPSGERFVAKIVSKAQGNVEMEVRVEIAILRRVRHDNVVRLIEILESPNNYYIILEPVLGGDMCDAIMASDGKGIALQRTRKLFAQLIQGVAACHAVGVAHRDLKPENLLLTEDGNLKISDFGLSRLHRHSQHEAQPHEYAKTLTGTLAYVSPEVLLGHYDAFKADIWSLGCILYVMCTGRFPFGSATGPALEERIKIGAYEPLPRSVPDEIQDLVRRLICTRPEQRPSLSEIAAHPFVAPVIGPIALPPPATAPAAAAGAPPPFPTVEDAAGGPSSPTHGSRPPRNIMAAIAGAPIPPPPPPPDDA